MATIVGWARCLQQAQRPLRFEICAANRYPSPEEWALLRAPWELLADQQGFLAGDVGLGFSPVRRIGRRVEPAAAPDKHRLGLVFMAASPFGVDELDYEAEETAIMAAVGIDQARSSGRGERQSGRTWGAGL